MSLLVAVIAIGIATVSWLRPPHTEPPSPKSFTPEEVQEAKANVCNAYNKVDRLGKAVTTKDAGTNAAGAFAIAVNTRLGLHAAAQYLQAAIDDNPATPRELVDVIEKLLKAYNELAVDQLGDAPSAETTPVANAINDADVETKRLCK